MSSLEYRAGLCEMCIREISPGDFAEQRDMDEEEEAMEFEE